MLKNGELLSVAEHWGFDVLVTADKKSGINRTWDAGNSRLSF